jgi:hypothetical protein
MTLDVQPCAAGSTHQEDTERPGSTRGLTGRQGALRPLAGAHSWADTGTGFLIGSASGLLVSYLPTRTASPTSPALSVSASPVQISLGGTFRPLPWSTGMGRVKRTVAWGATDKHELLRGARHSS